MLTVLNGHVLSMLATLPAESVQCVVTSPPYWGLRDYGIPAQAWGGGSDHKHRWGSVQRAPWANAVKGPNSGGKNGTNYANTTKYSGQWCKCGAWLGDLGLEPTPDLYIEHIVQVFREVRRVLRKDGTLWMNIGDCYATGAGSVGEHPGGGAQGAAWRGDKRGYRGDRLVNTNGGDVARKKTRADRDSNHVGKNTACIAIGPMTQPNRMPIAGLKPKDLVGIPWRVAFALQADGWWLRSDIIWHKPAPMPESVTDRPTRAHEYLFLFAKSERYYYNADAIKEPASPNTHARLGPKTTKRVAGWEEGSGSHAAVDHAQSKENGRTGQGLKTATKFGHDPGWRVKQNKSFQEATSGDVVLFRNKRTVWTVASEPFPGPHYATFPTALVEPCILAGCPPGGVVLDPFAGSGTVGKVAIELGREVILIELNPKDINLIEKRCETQIGMGLL